MGRVSTQMGSGSDGLVIASISGCTIEQVWRYCGRDIAALRLCAPFLEEKICRYYLRCIILLNQKQVFGVWNTRYPT